jgi:hypothetical protein
MATRMQQRRGTAAQWTAANPVLAAGEIGFETDTSKFKMGNGSSTWSALQYFANASELAALVNGAPGLLDTLDELAQAIGDDPQFYLTIGQTVTNHTNASTMVHGIADTSLLATQSDVNDAATAAASDLSNHTSATTTVHGIADTSVLATQSDVNDAATAAASDLSDHTSATTTVHGIADTSLLATQSDVNDAETAAASALAGHAADTTDVHGIADTTLLVTQSDLTDHAAETANVHGIADTTALVTQSDLTDAITGATVDQSALAGTGIDWNSVDERFDIDSTIATKAYADNAVSTHNTDETNVHGIANTADLATKSYADTAEADAITAAGTAADTKIATAVAALTKSSVGLGNVDNTSDANKPVSTAQQTALDLKANLAGPTFTGTVVLPSTTSIGNVSATEIAYVDGVTSAIQTQLDAKAPLASPGLTGTPTAPTATAGTNTTQIATTAFVKTAVDNVVASAPGALDTLNELATALGNDANFSTTITNSLAAKAPLASPTFTGTVTLPSGTVSTSMVADSAITSAKIADGTIVDADINASAAIATSKISGLDAALAAKAPLASPTFTGTVTVSASGVAFTDGTQTKQGVPSQTTISQKTDSYTLSALTERDTLIEMGKATAQTLTIPTNATVAFPVGTSIDILQTGAGQVTIAGASGVTVNATPGLKLRTQWSSATLFKRATDTWVIFGDLTA